MRPDYDSTIDDVAAVMARVPLLADMKPGGRFLAKDLQAVGGVGVVLRVCRIRRRLNRCCLQRTGWRAPPSHRSCSLISRRSDRSTRWTWPSDCAVAALPSGSTHPCRAASPGQTLKLCNQLIVATNLVAIAEALARASGLDLPMLPKVLSRGFADSLPLQIFASRMAAGITSPILGELSLMLKDMKAILHLAGEHQAELPLAARPLDVYRLAEERGLSRRDLAALFELYPIMPWAARE